MFCKDTFYPTNSTNEVVSETKAYRDRWNDIGIGMVGYSQSAFSKTKEFFVKTDNNQYNNEKIDEKNIEKIDSESKRLQLSSKGKDEQ